MDSGWTEKEIVEKIISAGCKRNKQTIRTWVRGTTNTPNNSEDIFTIGVAMGCPFSPELVDDICAYSSIYHGIRQAAGREGSKAIVDAFVADIKELGSLLKAEEQFELRHKDLGRVDLVCVAEVGETHKVDAEQLLNWHRI